MKILVLSGSPKGMEDSITYQYIMYLKKRFEDDVFETVDVKNGIYNEDLSEKIQSADLIMYTSSLYHFSVHAQSLLFFEKLTGYKDILKNKPFTYFSSSAQVMDVSAHATMESVIRSLGARYLKSLSVLDESFLNPGTSRNAQADVINWFNYIKALTVSSSADLAGRHISFVFLDATDGNNATLNAAMSDAKDYFSSIGAEDIKNVALRDYNISPCMSCGYCYTNRTCPLSDDFQKVLEEVYAGDDCMIIFSDQNFGQLSFLYKAWLDRHVQFGRHGFPIADFLQRVPAEKRKAWQSLWGYEGIVWDSSGSASHFSDNQTCSLHSSALCNAGGSKTYMGYYDVADNTYNMFRSLNEFLSDYAVAVEKELRPFHDFYSHGITGIFADLSWKIQKHAPADFEYYNKLGMYKLPDLNPHVVPVRTMEESMRMRHGRVMPFQMLMSKMAAEKFTPPSRKIPLSAITFPESTPESK